MFGIRSRSAFYPLNSSVFSHSTDCPLVNTANAFFSCVRLCPSPSSPPENAKRCSVMGALLRLMHAVISRLLRDSAFRSRRGDAASAVVLSTSARASSQKHENIGEQVRLTHIPCRRRAALSLESARRLKVRPLCFVFLCRACVCVL